MAETNRQKIEGTEEQHGIKIKENSFFDRRHKRLNIDLSHRCPLECLRCGRQRSFMSFVGTTVVLCSGVTGT